MMVIFVSMIMTISLIFHRFLLDIAYHLLEGRLTDDHAINNILIFYCVKQIDSILPLVCTVIDHKRHQTVVKTTVTHSAVPCVPPLCSYQVICDLEPFNSQDLLSNSPYCLPYKSCDVTLENYVLDPFSILKLIFLFILITYLIDIVLILY